jgi:hypothetical protein
MDGEGMEEILGSEREGVRRGGKIHKETFLIWTL